MKTQIIVLIIVLFVSAGCRTTKDEGDETITQENVTGELALIVSEPFYHLAQEWANEFGKRNSEVTIHVNSVSHQNVLGKLKTGDYDLGMTCMSTLPKEKLQEVWHVAVMKDGIIPITSASNPHLDQILERGIKKSDILNLFRQSDELTWGTLLNIDSETPVNIYRFNQRTLSTKEDETKMLHTGVLTDEERNDILDEVAGDPYSISFCNATYAYHCKKDNKRTDLKIIPVDLDENGNLDKKEQFYSRLDDLQRAQYLGIYPDDLCRQMAVMSVNKPDKLNAVTFIDYILHEGQQIAVNNGFARIRNSTADNIMQELAIND